MKSRKGLKRRLDNAVRNQPSDLNLGSCNLTEVPEQVFQISSLKNLQLAQNKIRELPPELASLPNLKSLSLEGNPLISPPSEVCEQGAEAILEFLRARLERTEKQWVSKLLVVGEGGVGKTQLLRHLRGANYDPSIPTTHGIEIQKIHLPHPTEKDVVMTLNAWDFGGQEIYHATHQFFLTNRSLFLIVWNARLGYEQGKLYYWLETINALAPDSPVLLVATHIDERNGDLPYKDLKNDYPQIRGSIKISNHLSSGIRELKEKVSSVASKLPLMGEKWPASWLKGANLLRDLEVKFAKPEKVNQMLFNTGVHSNSTAVLINWLHELGDLLYFPDDEYLSDLVILKPQWVSSYISLVLDDEVVSNRNGVFSYERMNSLWSDIPYEMRIHFLRLMEKFDLSYQTLENRDVSLVVERLPIDKPDYEDRWKSHISKDGNRSVSMRIRLASVPAGIPTWFIARSHRFTTYTHWRNGALFRDDDQETHLALVSCKPNEKTLDITVSGPNPQDFFALLRDGVELTLRRFPGLKVRRLIPCIGHEKSTCSHEFDYNHLLKATRQNPPVLEIQCPESFQNVSVTEMLFGIHWSTKDAVIQRIDEMEQRIGIQVSELRNLVQREFLKVYTREQSKIDSHCPNVLTILPKSPKGWGQTISGEKIEIRLYCQAPGEWHPCGENGTYEIVGNPKWLNGLAPYVKTLVSIIKYALPITGAALDVLSPDAYKIIEKDVKLMQALVSILPKIDETANAFKPDTTELYSDKNIGGSDLRQLRKLLQELDPNMVWGGLSKVLTPEGHYLWVCPNHAEKIERQS